MNYIVLDLEWNQPRWSGETVENPIHLVGEIVQIGAVKMDQSLSIQDELRLTVNPKYYKKMHRNVARITGLDNDAVRRGISFPEAARILASFCGKDFIFLTWGPDDIPMLRDNFTLFSLDEDWIPESVDLQVLFSHQKLGSVRQIALEDATQILGEEPFQAHDALCDAKSTALICRHLDMENGLQDYASLAGDITSQPLQIHSIPMHYENRGEALREMESTTFPCPECDGYLLPESIIPQNSSKYLALAECTAGERYLIRFRLYRGEKQKICCIREVFALNDNLMAFYDQKNARYEKYKAQERAKERRKRARRREKREAERKEITPA